VGEPTREKSFEELKGLIHEARTTRRDEAIGELLAKFMDYIRSLARTRITSQRQKFDSSDIQQEVVLALIEKLRSGKVELHTEAEFVDLLGVMTLSKFLDFLRYYRRLRRNIRLERSIDAPPRDERNTGDDPRGLIARGPGVSTEVGWREWHQRVGKFLEEILPDDQFYAFKRRYLEDASIEDLMQELGKTNGAVKQLLHRARDRVKKRLSESEALAGSTD
jgi:RNA polymerase sigma factor (sigma-70 family)